MADCLEQSHDLSSTGGGPGRFPVWLQGAELDSPDPKASGPHQQGGSAASYLSASAGLLIAPQHLCEGRGRRSRRLAAIKTHSNTFISPRRVPHTFSLLLYILLPLSAPLTPLSPHFHPSTTLHLGFSLGLIIWRSSLSQWPTEAATTGEQWREASRCNYNVPSIHRRSFSQLAPSLPALSAPAIAANFYHVSHLNRQNISPGSSPSGLPAACYRSIEQRSLISLNDRQPLGRMTHKETQTNIYLLHKHTLSPSAQGPQRRLDLSAASSAETR